jgi:ABC-type polysaccharide/polyol phosphate export permease
MTNGVKAGIDPGFFRILVLRQIRQDYLDNFTGFAWLLLQPLMLLAVYAFVFTTIFASRVPDAGDVAFVPWLAVAFWPWTAFSEAVLRASNSIISNAALIGKVSFASEQLPLAAVSATFLMHSAGFLAVLVVLRLTGTDVHWGMLAIAIPLLLMLWVFACAIALFTSASEVYIRDIAQILPPLFTFWFFTTPILYSPAMLPPWLAELMRWNPMTWFVGGFRDTLLFGRISWGWIDLAWPLVVVVLAWLGLRYFRRFSGHFEDFL